MKTLVIAETKQSPEVLLDAKNGAFSITGNSYPNNSFRFYLPILEWLDEYCLVPNDETTFVFHISYQNSSSLKMFNEIIKKLERLHLAGKKVNVQWKYQEDDEDLYQVGSEIQAMYKLPFELKSFKD